MHPNLTFTVETTTGTVINSNQTGDIGGASDQGTAFPGWYDLAGLPPPPFFYGVNFNVPDGIMEMVITIICTR